MLGASGSMTPTMPIVVNASIFRGDVDERVEFLADTFVPRLLGYIYDDSDIVAAARRAAAQARSPNIASRKRKNVGFPVEPYGLCYQRILGRHAIAAANDRAYGKKKSP